MKPAIHFHSDCPSFAGCENMLANFFNDPQLCESFDVSFSFRYSPEYEKGYRQRVPLSPKIIPLDLLDLEAQLMRIQFRPVRIMARIGAGLLLLKYWYVWMNTMRFVKLFRTSRIDILHINNGGYPGAYSCMAAVLAARIVGIKHVIYVVNNIAASYAAYGRLLDWPFDRLVRKGVIKFVTGSKYARDRLSSVLRLRTGQAISIPNGIIPRAVTEGPEETLLRLGLQHDQLILCVVGVLEERKGHLILLNAISAMQESFGSAAVPLLLIEGVGPMLSRLQNRVREMNLGSHVRFIGREANVFNLLNAADIVVLPSISHEDFPNITLEAMSLGKPVIGTRLSGIPEQIQDGETGLIVAPKDVQGLANAIHELTSDLRRRCAMSAAARQRFSHCFYGPLAVEKYINIYRQLLNSRPPEEYGASGDSEPRSAIR